MATFVLNEHRNAQLNEYAVWNGRPITFEDYMNSRMIAWRHVHLRQRYARG